MRRIISFVVAVALILAGGAALAASSDSTNKPWFLKRQDLSKEQYLAAVAKDDGAILRVKAATLARELNNTLGLPAPESPKALAAFLGAMSVVACTDALLGSVKMGRTNDAGSTFDYSWRRTKCAPGEKLLVYQGVPVLSLWCGNLIIAPKPAPQPVEAANECYEIYIEAKDGGNPIKRDVRLIADVWLKKADQTAKKVVYDPCFKLWTADRKTSWVPPRICDECLDPTVWSKIDEILRSGAPKERNRRQQDDMFEVLLRGGSGYLSLPKWYVGTYGADFLFCSPDEPFRHPDTRKHHGMWWWQETTAEYAATNGNPANDPVLFSK